MAYELNKNEKRAHKNIVDSFYMQPSILRVNNCVKKNGSSKSAWRKVFNELHNIMNDAKKDVEKILGKRKKAGKIVDVKQSIKSIAGSSFSSLIVYVFLNNKICGNIKPYIFITSKKSEVANFDKIATINVDGETQKPDCDLVIHSSNFKKSSNRSIILSLKTSLRERAGQTYRWKLLMEIASSKNAIKKKYNISYDTKHAPYVCFATVNFYNEINQPQQRGMFKFFDKAFIAKDINKNFISKLSDIVDFVNKTL